MSTTTNKGLNLPPNGQTSPTWDVPVNQNFTWIDTALGGLTNLNVVGASGVVTLSQSQYLPPNIIAAGAMTANINYQLPSGIGGRWTVYNNTSGAYSLTISSAGGGSSVTLTQGARTAIQCDGTNVTLDHNAAAGPAGSVQFNSGGVTTGTSNLYFDNSSLQLHGAFFLYGATSGYVGFKAPASSGNIAWTLPASDGTAGQFLTTNGAGVLSFTTVGTGVTSFSGGSTGLTPNTATAGAVTLGGVLAVANGGTGGNSATGSGAVVLATSPTLSSPTLSSPTLSNPTLSGTISGLPTATASVAGIATLQTSATFQYQLASGTNSLEGTFTTGWWPRNLTNTVFNNISGCSLAANVVTLPAGTYKVDAFAIAYTGSGGCYQQLRLRNSTDGSTTILSGSIRDANGGANLCVNLTGSFSISSTKNFELDTYVSTTSNGGNNVNSGENEVYVSVTFVKIG